MLYRMYTYIDGELVDICESDIQGLLELVPDVLDRTDHQVKLYAENQEGFNA